MAHSVVMPELGESVTEGTITQWLKAVGDTVSVDEPLLEVSTDKVDTEVPSPVAGVLLEIRAEEDDTIEVGDVIAIIGDAGEAPAATPAAPAAPAEPEPAPAAAAHTRRSCCTGCSCHLGHRRCGDAGVGRVGHRGRHYPVVEVGGRHCRGG